MPERRPAPIPTPQAQGGGCMPAQWVCGDSHALCTQLTLDTSGMWGLLLASEVASRKVCRIFIHAVGSRNYT